MIDRLFSFAMIRFRHMAWTHILRMMDRGLGNVQVKYGIGLVACTLFRMYQFMQGSATERIGLNKVKGVLDSFVLTVTLRSVHHNLRLMLVEYHAASLTCIFTHLMGCLSANPQSLH